MMMGKPDSGLDGSVSSLFVDDFFLRFFTLA
jgi:hypothetical protein